MYQIHFGANYESGTYGWTTNLDKIKKSIAWQLEQLKTDYIDYGFIHCLDEETDWDNYVKNGVLDYIKESKEKGIVKHIGISSHTPRLIQKALDTGLIDMVMFSINQDTTIIKGIMLMAQQMKEQAYIKDANQRA